MFSVSPNNHNSDFTVVHDRVDLSTNKEPSTEQICALWDVVTNFIKENKITCTEATISDTISENSYKLVSDICDIVGYAAIV